MKKIFLSYGIVEFRGQLDMKRDAAAVLRMYGKKASQDKIDSVFISTLPFGLCY